MLFRAWTYQQISVNPANEALEKIHWIQAEVDNASFNAPRWPAT
jgi:hypothetical protein